MTVDLKSKTARRKLPARREPHWHRLAAGFHIGFRVPNQGEGTWIARRTEDGKKTYQALGTFDDFDDAVKAAQAWREAVSVGIVRHDVTVDDACKSYLQDLKIRKGEKSADDAEGRFRRHVFNKPLGKIQLAKLTPKVLRDWLHAQVASLDPEAIEDEDDAEKVRRSKDTANRNLRTLKAALNLARKDGFVQSDFAWVGVDQFQGVAARREGVLSREQREQLLKHSREDFRFFIQALLFTGARPGEMAGLLVSDIDRVGGSLSLTGKTGRRTCSLSTKAKVFFESISSEMACGDFVFVNSWGNPWTKDTWKERFREAANAAGLPSSFVLYHLRHTAISEMLLAGLSPGLVSQLVGTSIEMIHRHYGHLLHDHMRELLDRANLG